MINKPTVFILGAGASFDFGFPVGSKLRAQIVNSTKRGNAIWKGLWDMGCYTESDILKFHNAFAGSGQESIDAFLERRTDFIEIGKAAIALALIPCEETEKIFTSELFGNNWYDFVFAQMTEGADSLEKFVENKLSFVTYNYDRSLTEYLCTAIARTYNIQGDKLAETMRNIPIIHLHGKLGHMWYEQCNNIREYNPNTQAKFAKIAADEIKIIHEPIENLPQFRTTLEICKQAKVICFLGFGYHSKNIERLHMELWGKKEIWGTTFGLTRNQQSRLLHRLHNYVLLRNNNVLDFLRHSCILSEWTPFFEKPPEWDTAYGIDEFH